MRQLCTLWLSQMHLFIYNCIGKKKLMQEMNQYNIKVVKYLTWKINRLRSFGGIIGHHMMAVVSFTCIVVFFLGLAGKFAIGKT